MKICEINYKLPKNITRERIQFLHSKGIDLDIAEIDLEMVKMKIQNNDDGIVWSSDQCEDAELEYKRYLTLSRHYPHPVYSIVPNKIMDTMWHYHILDTKAYVEDSYKLFGGYFHHYPYFGLRGEEDEIQLREKFEETKQLYFRHFGENMVRAGSSDCWHDCENRCWHACSNEK